jgi:hypothetical protein
LIFVSRAKLPVPLFSYLLFELKASPRLFRAQLLGGQLVYPKGSKAILFKTFRC